MENEGFRNTKNDIDFFQDFPGTQEANVPISSFLNEVTPICPSQIYFEVEGSKIFCSCAL